MGAFATWINAAPVVIPLDNIRLNKYSGPMPKGLQTEIKQKHAFASLEEEVFLGLLRTADLLDQSLEELLKLAGLSTTQYNVLRILRGAGAEGLTCGETGARMLTHDPDMTRLFDRLEKRGLIRRKRGSRDRRVVTACIIESGLELLRRLDKPVREFHRSRFAHLRERDLRILQKLLEGVRNLE